MTGLVANDVLALCRSQLSDTGSGMRWTDNGLLSYLSLAQKQVVLLRPDASSSAQVIQLDLGLKQAVPATAYRYLGAVQNMGSDGTTPGNAIANVDIGLKDAFDPTWRGSTTTASAIREAMFDVLSPREFWVWPAPVIRGYISIKVSSLPSDLVNLTDNLVVPAMYESALVFFTLGYAYGENSDVGDKSLSAAYMSQAMALLGEKTKVDISLPPAQKEDDS